MWIRSQDRKKLKEIHDVTIYHDKQIWAGCSFIGEYSTEEKALLVLDMIEKVDSFEWIPVSESLPKEHDSIFAKLYGTDKWDSSLYRTISNRVLVTVEYDDGTRIVKESYTRDGEWKDEKNIINYKVVAWMEMPEPYKEK